MARISEIRRQKSLLQLARKLLTTAILLQLPILVLIVLRQSDLMFGLDIIGTWQMPNRLFVLLWGGSSLLAIVGFAMVCRQLSLWDGDLEQTDFVRQTVLLGTRKIAASIQLFFYLSFLLPAINLIAIAWARSHASAAISGLAQHMPARRRP
jgi:hypothetical protein